MSEFDVNAGHEDFNLDHGHQEFGNENDHLQNFDAFGNQHASELDEHFAQGHHVESDSPVQHFEEADYTNADVHAAETDASFGEHVRKTRRLNSSDDRNLHHEHGAHNHM